MVKLALFSLLPAPFRNLLVESIPHDLLGHSRIVLFNFGRESGFRMSGGQTYQSLQCTRGQRRSLQAMTQLPRSCQRYIYLFPVRLTLFLVAEISIHVHDMICRAVREHRGWPAFGILDVLLHESDVENLDFYLLASPSAGLGCSETDVK